MQVVYHLGAPCTDNDALLASLQKNRLRLAQAGVAVPSPGRYRAVIRDTSRALAGTAATPEIQEALLDAIIDGGDVDRMVLSDPRFVCINRLVVQRAQIWPMIARSALHLRALFPDAQVTFFIGMRDPATLIPALFRASRFSDFEEFTENMQPQGLTWSEMLRRLQLAVPDCPITVWCNEDTPLIWGDVMRAMTGLGPESHLDGELDLIETIMDPAGFRRMVDWLKTNDPGTPAQRRRAITAFLERYALESEVEEVLNFPGWTEDLIDDMSRRYEADMDAIAAMEGVRLLMP